MKTFGDISDSEYLASYLPLNYPTHFGHYGYRSQEDLKFM